MKYVLSDWCQARPGLESTWNVILSPLSSQRLNFILLNPKAEVLGVLKQCSLMHLCAVSHMSAADSHMQLSVCFCSQTELPHNPVRDFYVTYDYFLKSV